MGLPSLILSAVMAGVPIGYEIDYSTLPPANTLAQGYKFTLVFQFAGYQDYEYPIYLSQKADPKEAAIGHALGLEETKWRWKKEGNKITVFGLSDARLVRLKVTGDGPKPAVRLVLATANDLRARRKPAVVPEKKEP